MSEEVSEEDGPAMSPAGDGDGRTPAVRVRRLTKVFGGDRRRRGSSPTVIAVDALDLEIVDGEFFGLLGPSGCGKTTMLRMIAGLDYPTEGSIEIFGAPVADTPPHRRPVNTVFQQYALFPHMSVADNVAFGLRMQKVAAAERARRVAEALALVRLDGLEERRPAELSGGQQQRVALARALVNRPRVLLLDEPLGALDQKLRVEMQQELQQLQRELGITFVFVTHDQEEALTMSDRIAVMRDGRILQLGTPDEVYERPADRFVADFIGEINLVDVVVADGGSVALPTGTRVELDTGTRSAGADASLAVRPERLRFATDPPAGRQIDATVEAATYLGNATLVVIRHEWLRLDVRVPAGESVPAIGSTASVTWEPGAMQLLDRTDD